MLWVLMLICIVQNVWCNGKDAESLVVNTKQGPVRGYKSPDGDFFMFYGIPYATAPTGSERFQAPLPPSVRLDTFEAVNTNIVCPQFNYFGLFHNGIRNMTENCLVANIYMPQTENKNLPVLVYIHGGGFALGFGEFTTTKQLAKSKKAIIVNFNYRLGAHGFLCLGTKDIPGNAGMKDQVALLRWVKDNIAGFGGNPDDVTISGYSAGSASVDLLMLSKMANGLFNKVIPESGANTAIFSIQGNPIEGAKRYAKQLNFSNVDNIYALEKFYKTASNDLLTSVNLLDDINAQIIFTPCIEQDTGVERFLDDSPVNILKSRNYEKRSMLYGFAKMEGMIRLGYFKVVKEKMNLKFSDVLPVDLKFKNEDQKEKVAEKVRNFYFGAEPISEDNIIGFVDYFTDTMFGYSTLWSVKLQVEAGNNQIYLYEYAYTDESRPIIPFINIRGADHCAQTWAIQDGVNITHSDESIASDGFKNVKRTLREMWLNFVTTGKPVPEGSSLPAWPPTGSDASPYMVLDKVPELKKTPLLEKRMQLWDEIYSEHYRYPQPPRIPEDQKVEL